MFFYTDWLRGRLPRPEFIRWGWNGMGETVGAGFFDLAVTRPRHSRSGNSLQVAQLAAVSVNVLAVTFSQFGLFRLGETSSLRVRGVLPSGHSWEVF